MFAVKKISITLMGLMFTVTAFAENWQPLNRLTLLTENYGQYNYSLNGKEFEHSGENIGGVSTEFLKKLLARAGIPYKMKLRTWRVSYERTLNRPNYGVFSTARTDLREDLFEWIGPIARYNWVLLKKKGSSLTINSLDDIRSLRFGGYQDDAVTQYIESQGIKVSALSNEKANPRMLHEGIIDVWGSSDATAFDIAKSAGYPDVEVAYVLRTVDMYLAMNKETDSAWLQQLNKAYNELVAEGELELSSY